MAEYERIREQTLLTDEKIDAALKDYRSYFYDRWGRRYEGRWYVLKVALKAQVDEVLRADGICIKADDQTQPSFLSLGSASKLEVADACRKSMMDAGFFKEAPKPAQKEVV